MKTILLAALLFQLLIRVKDSSALPTPATEHKYGDIIAFQRGIGPFNYMHFGIYIDKLRFKDYGQEEGHNIFEITGPVLPEISDCIFSKLDLDKPNVNVFNYLDDLKHITKVRQRTEELITERILCKVFNCPLWGPFANNCEHMATYIRYGLPISLQLGQCFEGQCHHKRNGLTKEEEAEILALLKKGYNGTEDALAAHYSGECQRKQGVNVP